MSKVPLEEASPVASAPPPCYEEAMLGSSVYQPQPPYNPHQTPYNTQYQAPVPVVHYPHPLPQQHGQYPVPPQQHTVPPQQPVQYHQVVTHSVVHPPTTRPPLLVGPEPLSTTCPHCNQHIVTKTKVKYRYSPHICCFLICLTVICSCFSCLPYCLCPSERVEHTCPKCKSFFGTYVAK